MSGLVQWLKADSLPRSYQSTRENRGDGLMGNCPAPRTAAGQGQEEAEEGLWPACILEDSVIDTLTEVWLKSSDQNTMSPKA